MAYKKPQTPQTVGADNIYPLTTIDQIIKSDGTRLDESDLFSCDELIPTGAAPLTIYDILFPIGKVELFDANTNPNALYVGTTWTLIGTKLAVKENVFGNGKVLGLTDGSSSYGMSTGVNAGANSITITSIGNNVGSGITGSFTSGKGIGVPTKSQLGTTPQNSGLIVDTESIYSWRRTA